MKYWLLYTICVIGVLLYSCSNKTREKKAVKDEVLESSLNAIAPAAARDTVQTIITKANCMSPKGAYTTEVHTATGGYHFFRQDYSFKPGSFEVILTNDSTGYTGDRRASSAEMEIIRGHAFHAILFELPRRYHAFTQPVMIKDKEGLPQLIMHAKDRLGHECSFTFDDKTKRLISSTIKNPADSAEQIHIIYAGWRQTGAYMLPWQVDIFQGKDKYVFHFTNISINNPAFKQKRPLP